MNSIKAEFDIIIVGAGPAGATAVIALQNSGLKIAVIDKDIFPRDKICGDAVSSVAKRILRQINPDLETDLLDFAPKSNITTATVYSPKFEKLEVAFSKVGHCIRRIDFDNWLYNHALKNTNATFFHNNKVKNIAVEKNNVTVKLEKGETITANLIIGCDGAHSEVAKQLAGFKVNKNHYSGAIRQYYKNIKGLTGNSLEVYFLKDYLPGYFWIFPLSNNEANVGFGMLSKTISEQKIDLKKSMNQIINNIPEIAERFKNATPLEDVKGFGLPLGSKKYAISGNNFMLCGDAASLIDPFSGEGIETAMESGKFAAEQAIKCFTENNFTAAYLQAYDARVYKKMWPNFKNHYILQRILGKKVWLINMLISIGNINWVKRLIPKVFY